jgi:hypothetical protein
MNRLYLRTTPGPRETVAAALVATGAALGVAAISFYLTRILLSREILEPIRGGRRGPKEEGEGGIADAHPRGGAA